MDNHNPDLETFRRKWQEEVSARSTSKRLPSNGVRAYRSHERYDRSETKTTLPPSNILHPDADEVDGISAQAYHDLDDKDDARRLGVGGSKHPQSTQSKEPKSALEHFEKAIEREDQGNLGDSVSLYRQAYRLDSGVDRIYKNKHFPPSNTKTKPIDPNPSNAAVTVPNPAHQYLDGPSISNTNDLIASFSNTTVPAAAPAIKGTPPPPCHIAKIPAEILIDILLKTAIADIASFARLSMVCKRLAYLVATEDRIWERICRGHEYGFAAMYYIWNTTISGGPLPSTLMESTDDLPQDPLDPISTLSLSPRVSSTAYLAPSLPTMSLSAAYPSYRQMLCTRPRLRFNGCYISTVNYHRPGVSTASTNSTYTCPVHIVTYYRYLRFFRDGTCLSLLTTTEPADVVHYLTKEHLLAYHNKESMLPSAIMRHALKGRWRLSGGLVHQKDDMEKEGDVDIETEGVDTKYVYKMQLSLRSAGRPGGTRNNKLAWKGFWSYNQLTDDWATFTLRNDRAFFWSRVKSYATG
ncbi:MAG: hypothetical protein Q9168_002699 [Polycauliona sp. 1 TL-2023]